MAYFLVNLVLVPTLLILAGYGLRAFALSLVSPGLLRTWLYPGVMIHELSHAAACLPALAKVRSVTLIRSDGSGEVEHEEPKLPVLGMVLISLAPLAGGPLALWGLNWLLDSPWPDIHVMSSASAESLAFIGTVLEQTWIGLSHGLANADWSRWQLYVVLIMTVSVALTMIPSDQDLKNALKSAVLLLVLIAAWLLISNALELTRDPVKGVVEWVLLRAHIGLVAIALAFVVLLVLAGVTKVLGKATGSD